MEFSTKCLVFLAIFGYVELSYIEYNDCGSDYDLDRVEIVGCNTQINCVVNRGRKHTINFVLYAKEYTSKYFNQEVHLQLKSLYVPLPVTPDNLCSHVICPVTVNQNASFTAIMDFTNMPDVQDTAKLHWKIYNENKKLVMCIETKVKYEYPRDLI